MYVCMCVCVYVCMCVCVCVGVLPPSPLVLSKFSPASLNAMNLKFCDFQLPPISDVFARFYGEGYNKFQF